MPYNYAEYDRYLNSPQTDNHRLLKPFLQEFFAVRNDISVLDVGCGTGYLAQTLGQLNFQGEYLGFDIDVKSIDYCKSLTLPQKYNFLNYYQYLNQVKSDSTKDFDLVIFSLTACEMSEQILKEYFETIRTKQFLLINPSSITSYYEHQAYKPWISKIFSRLGQRPQWILKASIDTSADKYSVRKIGNNPHTLGISYYRNLGDLLNLAHQTGLNFEQYWDLKYTENTVKTAPISKFEAVLLNSK